jgi:hypothetical protein
MPDNFINPEWVESFILVRRPQVMQPRPPRCRLSGLWLKIILADDQGKILLAIKLGIVRR